MRDLFCVLPQWPADRYRELAPKYTRGPRRSRLSTEGAPAGVDPDLGDLTYYARWGNLAIFYRDSGFSEGPSRRSRRHPPSPQHHATPRRPLVALACVWSRNTHSARRIPPA